MRSIVEYLDARQRQMSIIGLCGLLLVLALLPLGMTPYTNYQLGLAMVFSVAIIGLNFVSGEVGQISLGQSAFVGLGAYVTCYGIRVGWNILLTIVLAIVLPTVVAIVIGLPVLRLRGHGLAIVTLAIPVAGVPLAQRFVKVTGGAEGTNVNWLHAPKWSHLADDQWRYYIAGVILLVAVALAHNIGRGKLGRAFRALRTSEALAASIGVRVHLYKVMSFALAACFGGAAGVGYAAVVQYTSLDVLSFLVSINMLAALVIGGLGTVSGSVIGGFVYVFLPVIAGEASQTGADIYEGIILLIILLVSPGGIVGIARIARGRSLRGWKGAFAMHYRGVMRLVRMRGSGESRVVGPGSGPSQNSDAGCEFEGFIESGSSIIDPSGRM